MKLVSWLLTLFILLVAICFALNNSQSITVSLWPFGIELVAPLYLLSLGTLFLGLLIGAVIGWITHLPHRLEARRLRRDIAGLREKIEDLRAAPPLEKSDTQTLPSPSLRWRVWGKR
jgi:uncharacterized integral membrane protein